MAIAELRRLGLDRDGSISLDSVESAISEAAGKAEAAARGSPADAVVWEEVEARTSESAELSFRFLAFMVLATLIASVGIMVDSQILIIGAMVVGPEFGPWPASASPSSSSGSRWRAALQSRSSAGSRLRSPRP